MSTRTTYNGPVIQLAVNYEAKTESSHSAEPTHHVSHVDVHTTSEDLSVGTVAAKRIQVFPSGGFAAGLPDGLVAENASITEELNVIDGGRIKVQPSEETGTPVVVVGKAASQSLGDAGVLVNRGHREVRLNAKMGLYAKKLNVYTSRMEGKSAEFSDKCKTTQLFAKEIRPLKGSQKTTFVGDLHVTGKLSTVDLNVSGASTKKRRHLGDSSHQSELTLDDNSLYIGLMRRSYDRATQKPVTHVLKRQIPAYLVAKGFVLADIPAPFTVTNMTINNWVTIAQDYLQDTSIGVSTVFPAATTADWEDFIDPISIDLDAAEVDIADHESRISVLEGASSGGGELSNLTLLTATNNNDTITIPPNTVGLVLIAHDNLSGINGYLPAMNDRDIILVKNLNLADGGDEVILLHAAAGSGVTFDGRWSTIQLNASSVANNNTETYANQCARLQYITIYPNTADEQDIYCRLNDSY